MMAIGNIKQQNIRHIVIVLFLMLAAFSVSARVAYVHIEKSEFLKQEGERHYKRNIPIYAYRGNILDRNGHELAVSAPAISIWADPDDVLEHSEAFEVLAGQIDVDFFALKRRAEKTTNRSFMYIKRQVGPRVADIVAQSGLDVVGVIKERKRVYPEADIFSQVIGMTDIDYQGVEGVELAFNEYLQGANGIRSVIRDRIGRSFEVIETPRDKVDGGEVSLSLDRNIQYIAYSELKRALSYHEASSGMMVVLDAKAGRVLSMVNYPSYNPNERSSLDEFALRNRTVTDVFEPGSAIKPFVMAAAMEQGVIDEREILDVNPGYISIGDKKVSDSSNYNKLNAAGVLAKSSNVGMVQIASRIDDEYLAEKLRSYGLFSPPGIELPGESSGLFVSQPDWGPHYKSFLSFGYGAATSALQLANAYMVLANNGVRRDITVLDGDNRVPGMQVMQPEVANRILRMLQGVVQAGGTGAGAATMAYQVVGKTGTAKKLKAGIYQDDAYIALFSGVAPLSDPQIVVAVIVDDPRKNGVYGGQVAAPVFSRVVSRVLRYLDVAPDKAIDSFAVNTL